MRKYNIGEVCAYRQGQEGIHDGLIGQPRIDALRGFFKAKQWPEGLAFHAWNPKRPVEWEAVNWASAGERVTS